MNEKWKLVVAGSAYGGRGFGPCSYPRGGLEINHNHHHHHIYINLDVASWGRLQAQGGKPPGLENTLPGEPGGIKITRFKVKK